MEEITMTQQEYDKARKLLKEQGYSVAVMDFYDTLVIIATPANAEILLEVKKHIEQAFEIRMLSGVNPTI